MKRKVTLLDGAVGTSLWAIADKNGVAREPVWKYNISHPEFVSQLAGEYLQVGSEIILTNTFGANGPSVKRSSKYEVADVIRGGVEAVQEAIRQNASLIPADKKIKVSLAAGPLSQLMEPYGDLTEEEVEQTYQEMLEPGVKAGADMIMLMTFMDLEMMKVATRVALRFGIPVFCTMTFEKVGKTMMGNSVQDVIEGLEPMGISAIGMNCSLGPDLAVPVIRQFQGATKLPLVFKPNAGKPILAADGSTVSDYTAQKFAEEVKPALDFVDYIGGCCGSDPSYIREIKKIMDAAE